MKKYLSIIGLLVSIFGLGLLLTVPQYQSYGIIITIAGALIVGGIPKFSKIIKKIDIPLSFLILGVLTIILYYQKFGLDLTERHLLGWLSGLLLMFSVIAVILRAVFEK